MAVIERIICNGCGKDLIITNMKLDTWGNLTVEIERCEDCYKEAYDEGVDDTNKEDDQG